MSTSLFDLPKDRIELNYISEQLGDHQRVELPFKLLLLGNYKGREEEVSITDRRCVNVETANFPEVMREAKVRLQTTVEDKLSSKGSDSDGSLAVDIQFDSLRDFHPDAFAKQVPELDTLLKFRKLLTKAKTEPQRIQQTVAEIRALLQAE
ncbi:MAG: type VI secretion system contractile sheath small subunit [Pseudomonadales bacterium]